MHESLHPSLYSHSFYVTLKFTPKKEDLVSPPLDSEFIPMTNECKQTWHKQMFEKVLPGLGLLYCTSANIMKTCLGYIL